jgi:glutamate dehydrogenase
LLDITDNIKQGEVVYPDRVVRHDDDDPYLVVAADKGTATFSDIANGISDEYEFWLGDAFASGGSVGYDHKGMGITARGGWESVKRHFREMDIDCQTTDFTCVGVGDMSGDVFGNGMLLSEHTRLICAFNHLHIFFDPNPDAQASYKERQRLFDNPSLSWSDYSEKLISKGGGIFSRSAKSIDLTPEMKKWLSTKQTKMTPNALINAVLQMPVDLFWNGGIGTYIKGSEESHAEVGDRANDGLRVNGNQVRAKIIGEGGNLGVTQLGRIEFAGNGGRVNTDFIDNVGGVDCSDNEVNIKVLLNSLVGDGDLTVKQRNELLYEMTDDVAELVLQDCYRQTQSISITEQNGSSLLKEQTRFIHGIEKQGKLNRELEFLPTDDEISDRLTKNKGLTRPELSVLIAYAKMLLKEDLNIPEITNNPYHNQLLITAFPDVLRQRYTQQMQNHPLKSEIVATKLANNMINDMGVNFAFRMEEETGAKISEIVDAYTVAKEVFDMGTLWESVEDLDNKIASETQLYMLGHMRRSLRRATRWFLRHIDFSQSIDSHIESFQPAFDDLHKNLLSYLDKSEAKELEANIAKLVKQQVPDDIAYRISTLSNMFPSLDISQVAEKEGRPISLVAKLYFSLGAELEIHWFLEQINQQAVSNHWQALARASFREEVDWQQRVLTGVLLGFAPKDKQAEVILDKWMSRHNGLLERWNHMMAEFKTSSTHEFAKFSVALRELMLLSLKCH